MLGGFDSVRVINLADRADRRREMIGELKRIGAGEHPGLQFFTAQRPADRAV